MARKIFKFSLPNWGKITDQGDTVRSIIKIAELGFDGMEFWAGAPYKLLHLGSRELKQISRTLEDYGVQPVSIAPDYDAGPGDWWRTGKDFYSPVATPEKFTDRVAKSIEIGHKLGCIKCNIQTMNRPKDHIPREKAWRNLVSSFSKCAEIAEQHNVALCHEPEPGMMFSSEKDILDLLNEIPSMELLVDTCLIYTITGGKPADFIRKAGSRVRHVHICDQNESINKLIEIKDEKINCPMDLLEGRVTVGTGVLNMREIIDSLLETGYRGWITIENAGVFSANADECVVKGRNYVRKMLEAVQTK